MRSIVVLILAVLIAGSACAQIGGAQVPAQQPPLSFRVTGEAEGMPDLVFLRYTVVGDGETVIKANEQARVTEENVVKALAKFEISQSQIEANGINTTPIQPNNQNRFDTSSQTLGFRIQKDYKIRISLKGNSTGRLLQIADAVFQQSVRVSSNQDYYQGGGYRGQQQGSLFEYAQLDSDKLNKAAMDDGIAQARTLAEHAAEQMGKKKVTLSSVKTMQTTTMPGSRSKGMPAETQSHTADSLQPLHVTMSMDVSFDCE